MKLCTTCGAEYRDEILFCERDGTPLRASDQTRDLVGSVIAERYHVQHKLGEGGMGQVYLAEHVKMGRRCAIKIMTQSMMHDADAISRFNREAANASRISHPNVCAVYDFGETKEGLIYLAMEYIQGQSLTDLLRELGPMSLPRAAVLLGQTADALHAAHDLGIVHRDLKPDNIMVISSRGKDTVKVVDFGIAKATGQDPGAQKVTRTGLVVGTPEYMSPEQLSGDVVDGRSDIYSLALVFYRMITGRLPFDADSAQEVMVKRLTDEPMPLNQARPDRKYPPGLQAILDRALARWPAERYATATEFGRDVIACAGSATPEVDVDAGTHVVSPEEMKKALSTVPQTRVDPGVQRTSTARPTVVAEESAPARWRGGRAAGRKGVERAKRLPIGAIAAGVAALAVGGGLFAFKDKLGVGSTQTPPDSRPDSATPASTIGNPNVVPLRGGDTTVGVRPGTAQKPAGNRTARQDSIKPVSPPPVQNPVSAGDDVSSLQKRVSGFNDDPEFVDNDAKRAEGKALGERVYGMASMPAKTRAEAAFIVGQALMKENDRSGAKLWTQRAVDLDPRDVWKSILATL